MTHDRCPATLTLAILLALGSGACGPDLVDDDDTGEGDDDASGDDDTTGVDDGPFASIPADGDSLSWDGCISLAHDGDGPEPAGLRVSARDEDGNELLPFAGLTGYTAMVMPTRPWPPGQTVELELIWDGGTQVLTFHVDALSSATPDPTGDGWALNLTWGDTCPDYDPISLVLPEERYSLVDVMGVDGQGAAELRVGLSGQDTVTQDPCVATTDVVGSYSDPLLWADAGGPLAIFPPLDSAARSTWLGVELAPGGEVPVSGATGAMMDGDALDELVEDDACELLSRLAAPWCGACPDAPDEECLYIYIHAMPTTERAALLMERDEEDIQVDPACDPPE